MVQKCEGGFPGCSRYWYMLHSVVLPPSLCVSVSVAKRVTNGCSHDCGLHNPSAFSPVLAARAMSLGMNPPRSSKGCNDVA